MPSALIPAGRGQPAVPLARQLAHQRSVRPGPLVLGTALLKSPARATDRDRHVCYPRPVSVGGQVVSVPPGSPCRHGGRTISSALFPTARGWCAVRRMASEDSERLHSMHSPIATAPIHQERPLAERSEPCRAQVLPEGHRLDDLGEDQEVQLLRAQQWVRLEEGNHSVKEIPTVPNDQHQSCVDRPPMVLPYPSTAEPLADQVEDLTAFGVLTYMELRDELPTGVRPGVPLDGDVK